MYVSVMGAPEEADVCVCSTNFRLSSSENALLRLDKEDGLWVYDETVGTGCEEGVERR